MTKEEVFALLDDAIGGHHQYDDAVQHVIGECGVCHMLDTKPDMEGVAISILHYILTRSSTPSQRVVDINDTLLDVVLPNMRHLQKRPADSLVILVCCEQEDMQSRIWQARCHQPIHDNLWVLTAGFDAPHNKSYAISETFGDMIRDMIRFSEERGHRRLGMAP